VDSPEVLLVDFFPDWGHRWPLWGGLDESALSSALTRDLKAWTRTWQVVLDPVFEVRWPDPVIGREWIAEGNRLVARLQAELGPGYLVVPSFERYSPDAKS
jgi:hypothetical protein